MFLKEIRLHNYRNYFHTELHFRPGVSLFIGANGQGKSNLLEAIYCLCFGLSFRSARDEDMVCWNKPYYFLQGTIYSKQCCYQMEVGYALTQKRKVIKVNKRLEKKRGVYNFPVIFFVPEDLEIIRRGPEERRRFLDRELSQLSPAYAADLAAYKRALLQKNRLLKGKNSPGKINDCLAPWNKQLVQYGSRIVFRRLKIIHSWSKKAAVNYGILFQGGQQLEFLYNSNIGNTGGVDDPAEIADSMSQKIKLMESEEFARGYALVGPHKDDLVFLLDKREAKKFASHGQQRSAIIALKAAQVQYYRETREKPLFLIDDVFSELDEQRRKQCLRLFNDASQVFMTLTGECTYPDNWALKEKFTSIFCVHAGKIEVINR